MGAPPQSGSEHPTAVVVGLDSITGLQTARILAAQGIPVVSLARNRRNYCCRTRVCRRILEVDISSAELVVALNRLAPDIAPRAVLFPCTDMSVYLLAAHQDELDPRFCRDLPSLPVIDQLMDKAKCQQHAAMLGLPAPQTHLLHSRADAERAAANATFPCVLKPALKDAGWERAAPEKAFLLHQPEHLLEEYDRVAACAEVMVLQQWIEGDDTSLFTCNCFFDGESRPRATCVTQKIRQWPPRIGTSCLSVSCRNDAVLAATVRLFQSLRYRGLAYTEVKLDPRSGEYLLIEANVGRPTGRSAMAEAGGIPLLYTKYCDSLGWALPEPPPGPVRDVKWTHWRRDLQASFRRWREGELTWREWIRSVRGTNAYAVLDRRDPGPFFAELVHVAGKVIRRTADLAR